MGRRPALLQRAVGLRGCQWRARIYVPLARELQSQQRLLEMAPDDTPTTSGPDTHLLDVAAHWMEIRSGREDILHK